MQITASNNQFLKTVTNEETTNNLKSTSKKKVKKKRKIKSKSQRKSVVFNVNNDDEGSGINVFIFKQKYNIMLFKSTKEILEHFLGKLLTVKNNISKNLFKKSFDI